MPGPSVARVSHTKGARHRSTVHAVGSIAALPVLANEGYFTVNGVCTDVWPTELAHFTTFDNFQRAREPVFTAGQLADLTAHPDWAPGQTWTLQVTASSWMQFLPCLP